jgi:hypothetical protein
MSPRSPCEDLSVLRAKIYRSGLKDLPTFVLNQLAGL